LFEYIASPLKARQWRKYPIWALAQRKNFAYPTLIKQFKMKWITRERPKIDRIACPWLIKRFVDKEAEFIYVPAEKVLKEAQRFKAIPFDIPGVKYSHYGDECTFDYIVKRHKIEDEAVHQIAVIVRGADTHRFDLAEQSAGLWAISAGLSVNYKDDDDQLEIGMKLYDALYSWAKFARDEKHTWNPIS
jgi:hypothetical protein